MVQNACLENFVLVPQYDGGTRFQEDEEEGEGGGAETSMGQDQTFYDAVKEEMAHKLMRTREVLDNLSAQRRVTMEGHLPGSYVRMKLKGLCSCLPGLVLVLCAKEHFQHT